MGAIDVALARSSVCVIDAAGQIFREAKLPSERAAMVAFLERSSLRVTHIGLEAVWSRLRDLARPRGVHSCS